VWRSGGTGTPSVNGVGQFVSRVGPQLGMAVIQGTNPKTK
jgi:hypothetical protein